MSDFPPPLTPVLPPEPEAERDPLPRIEALTNIARRTWFVLLGVLVFVGVTVMGVEHIDFYGVKRATELPLVNVSVPTRLFFFVAPILTAAAYGYFHLYLIRLWDALGRAPANVGGETLNEVIPPWLVSDAALRLRTFLRPKEPLSAPRRSLETTSMVLNMVLTWGFGLVVLGYAWWISMSARSLPMTLVAAASLFGAAFIGLTSLALLFVRMGPRDTPNVPHVWTSTPALALGGAAALVILPLSAIRTTGPIPLLEDRIPVALAPVDLSDQAVVERPPGWLPRNIAFREFRAAWCRRDDLDCTSLSPGLERSLLLEWQKRRRETVDMLAKPEIAARNLQDARLDKSFLAGVDFEDALMHGANLSAAQLEYATLRSAHLVRALMIEAEMSAAFLTRAQLPHAKLNGANLTEAVLWKAQLPGADLTAALLDGADLRRSNLAGANLRYAKMRGTSFDKSDLSRATLHRSLIFGPDQELLDLSDVGLNGTLNNGGAVRNADLRSITFDAETDFRNAFLDGSVHLPVGFARQMGFPCQWAREPLDDEEFFRRWRGWNEANPDFSVSDSWANLAPLQFADLEAIPPPAGCEWQTGPMPGAAGKP